MSKSIICFIGCLAFFWLTEASLNTTINIFYNAFYSIGVINAVILLIPHFFCTMLLLAIGIGFLYQVWITHEAIVKKILDELKEEN